MANRAGVWSKPKNKARHERRRAGNTLGKTMDRAPPPGSADRLPAANPLPGRDMSSPKEFIGARVEIESDEIGGWLASMASFSAAVILALSRSATFCAISLWIANRSFKSRSYCSAQTWVSVRVSINCAFKMKSGRRSCGRCPPAREIPAAHHRSGAYFVCRDIPSRWSG